MAKFLTGQTSVVPSNKGMTTLHTKDSWAGSRIIAVIFATGGLSNIPRQGIVYCVTTKAKSVQQDLDVILPGGFQNS